MTRVFLSYSRQDLAVAERIATGLEQRGHELWWDRHLEGGSRFASEIEAALERAEAIVVLWSSDSLKSAWVQDEAAEGRDRGRLVPVLIDTIKPPLGFRQFHTITYRKGPAEAAALDSIDRAIAGLAGAGKPPSAAIVGAESRPRPAGRRWSRSGIAAGAAAVLITLGAIGWRWVEPPSGRARLAVGSFAALSPRVPTGAAAALREELMSELASDGQVEVAASGSGPGYVAAGSIATAGDMLRFTLHLTDPAKAKQIWASSFERPLADGDVAPRQVAVAASMILRCGLVGASQHRGGIGADALALYLNYCSEYWAETAGREMSASRGLDFARRLVELEPDFSRGWSARARMAAWARRTASAGTVGALTREAAEAARKALKLDSLNSQGFEVLALLAPPNSVARENYYRRSVSVRPGDCGCEHVGYGSFLAGVGRLNEAIEQYRRALDMVPLSVSVNASLAEGLMTTGRESEGMKLIDSTVEIWPLARQVHETVVRAAFSTRQTERARRSLADPGTPFTSAERDAFGSALAALGKAEAARGPARAKLIALAEQPEGRTALLIPALAALGGEREAIAMAARILPRGPSSDQAVLFEPAFDRARRTAEFADLVERLGLTRYWRESGRRPDFCAGKDAPPLCNNLH